MGGTSLHITSMEVEEVALVVTLTGGLAGSVKTKTNKETETLFQSFTNLKYYGSFASL